ncbi:MAG: hypothetical protein HDS35_08350 [Bacteroides sp.]|nr:hypothetical protein [Bacteroides sp.]
MKFFKYLATTVALLILAACSSEDLPLNEPGQRDFAYVTGDKVVINIGIDAPELTSVKTRALTEDPDYTDMHLYLVEFADNGHPRQNTYITTYEPISDSEIPETDKVKYQFELNATSRSRILHLIALPKDQKLEIDYGIEATVIPNLKTAGGVAAYWRRLEFKNGYAAEDGEGNLIPSKEMDQLQHVALVRNFARITMSNVADNFELLGFAIVNNPSAGTMAPWNATLGEFPQYLDAESQNQIVYENLSKAYSGFVPADVAYLNQEAGAIVNDDVTPKYLYERPFNSIRHTYVLIKGKRTADSAPSYYKLDIGKNDNDGVFRYYNLLRNFSYNINIKSVAQKGYDSIQEAVQGVVYNNFSFDVSLSSMLNISDGSEIVYVNFTTAVITDTEPQVLEFKYRYRNLDPNSPTYNNENIKFIGLEDGSVVNKVEYGTTNDENGWRTVKLYVNGAQTETKTQSFIMVNSAGLGRTINLILHRKWTLQNVKEFPGTLENWDSSTEDEGEVGDAVGSDFTIFFDVPDNLEEAMFPLVFTLEADRQNMENNPLGALVVTSGPSGFSGVQGNRIKYEKSVTWTQYNDPLTDDIYDNGTAIPNGDGTFTHRVRCRFRTTTDLANLPFEESTTRVRITNDNFNVANVEFHREQ